MRKYKRYLAKKNMERMGLHKVCKHSADGSFFARHWRGYISF